MNDQTALLAAILSDPADDTARLVYADWLDENGQPERAAFIRVQVELANRRPYVAPPEILEIANSDRLYSKQASDMIASG